MIRHLLHVEFDQRRGLQEQVRETLVNAILSGIFSADTLLPSCRQLASQLRVSRNTTALVFESLVSEGYLYQPPAQRILSASRLSAFRRDVCRAGCTG